MAVSRRSFIKTTSAAAAALSTGIAGSTVSAQSTELKPGPGNKWPGRIAINFNKDSVLDLIKPQTEVIKKMVDRC